jgi:hypothetical protein
MRIATLIILLGIGVLTACEENTRIALDSSNPPKISLSGSGHISLLTVEDYSRGEQNESSSPNENTIIWWIAPRNGITTAVRNLEPISYGTIPSGFIQKIPENGSPPALQEGHVYEIWVAVSGAKAGSLKFTMKNGRATVARPSDGL